MNVTTRYVTLGLLVLALTGSGAYLLKWKDLPHEDAIIIASEPAASSVSGDAADEWFEPVREIAEEDRKTLTEKLWPLNWSNVNPDDLAKLIKKGADVNARDSDGRTPLMRAAKYNTNPEIITALIDAGADVNAKNEDGETPLMLAVRHKANPKVIAALIEAGADVNARDDGGHTAMDFAEENLRENKSEIMTLLRKAVSGDIEVVPQRRDENEE